MAIEGYPKIKPVKPRLEANFTRSLPGGKMDDSTYEQIENALDKIEAPMRSPEGKWLTLVERILAIGPLTPNP